MTVISHHNFIRYYIILKGACKTLNRQLELTIEGDGK